MSIAATRGFEVLHEALRRHPDSPEAWDAWLTGLYQASEADKLTQEFAHLPKALAADPRFAKHEGMIAQIAKDWPAAARAYGRAFAFEPFNWAVCYRLRFALRQAGETAEYERINQIYEVYKGAYKQMRGILLRDGSSLARLPTFPRRISRSSAELTTRHSRSRLLV